MHEAVQFGFINSRLVVDATPQLVQDARARDASLGDITAELATNKYIAVADRLDEGLTFGINARALGRAKSFEKKAKLYDKIHTVIGSLVAAQSFEVQTHPPALYVAAYQPVDSGEFGLQAHVRLPEMNDNTLRVYAQRYMARMARELKFNRSAPSHELGIATEVDMQLGVGLTLGAHSSVQTAGERFRPDERCVELSGHNVRPYHEPLIYLAGLAALAHADTLDMC